MAHRRPPRHHGLNTAHPFRSIAKGMRNLMVGRQETPPDFSQWTKHASVHASVRRGQHISVHAPPAAAADAGGHALARAGAPGYESGDMRRFRHKHTRGKWLGLAELSERELPVKKQSSYIEHLRSKRKR